MALHKKLKNQGWETMKIITIVHITHDQEIAIMSSDTRLLRKLMVKNWE